MRQVMVYLQRVLAIPLVSILPLRPDDRMPTDHHEARSVRPARQDVVANLFDCMFHVHDNNDGSVWIDGRCEDESEWMWLVGGGVHIDELSIGDGPVYVCLVRMKTIRLEHGHRLPEVDEEVGGGRLPCGEVGEREAKTVEAHKLHQQYMVR